MTHDITMVIYLLCTLPWQLGVLYTSPSNAVTMKRRRILTTAFFGTLPPMIYFFLQHKVSHVPGGIVYFIMCNLRLIVLTVFCIAYTIYAFFEWSLIIYDVAFDAVTSLDFEKFELKNYTSSKL